MLEKPDISDERIISHLQEQYGLDIAQLDFLPLGADLGTAVYRVFTKAGDTYFLKLRKGFEDITVTVPLFLKSKGIGEIISPIETKSNQAWADFREYQTILYPFIYGQDGFTRELTDDHRRRLGAALKAVHSVIPAPELQRLLPKETFSAQWREMLKSFLVQVQNNSYSDVVAAKLATFMKSKQGEIAHLIERTAELASELQATTMKLVLCHTDIHGGNILISNEEKLYIVDWDNPLLAPKERDLMFIGGGIDSIWKSEREEAVFYDGYGETKIDLKALAYYRYERVIEDLAVTCEQLLLSNEGGEDRERSYRWFTSNFEPGSTTEIAKKTDPQRKEGQAD